MRSATIEHESRDGGGRAGAKARFGRAGRAEVELGSVLNVRFEEAVLFGGGGIGGGGAVVGGGRVVVVVAPFGLKNTFG